VSDTHTGRAVDRRSRFCGFTAFAAFYHIAAMGNWQEVVLEQKRITDAVGLRPQCLLLGSDDDAAWARKQGLDVRWVLSDLSQYETPTLERLHDWCFNNRDGAVLYFHTKGVSNPQHVGKRFWRWLMMEHVVARWEYNLKRLELVDLVGVCWQDSPWMPHFSGNFWMARADWVSVLRHPRAHRDTGGPSVCGNPWERMHAELWIGSEPWHSVDSLVCRNEIIWEADSQAYRPYDGLTFDEVARLMTSQVRP
jgi:hypothetical protein